MAHCGAGTPCQNPGPQYCSVHVPVELHNHPDPDHPYRGRRLEDQPIVRMTVATVPGKE